MTWSRSSGTLRRCAHSPTESPPGTSWPRRGHYSAVRECASAGVEHPAQSNRNPGAGQQTVRSADRCPPLTSRQCGHRPCRAARLCRAVESWQLSTPDPDERGGVAATTWACRQTSKRNGWTTDPTNRMSPDPPTPRRDRSRPRYPARVPPRQGRNEAVCVCRGVRCAAPSSTSPLTSGPGVHRRQPGSPQHLTVCDVSAGRDSEKFPRPIETVRLSS